MVMMESFGGLKAGVVAFAVGISRLGIAFCILLAAQAGSAAVTPAAQPLTPTQQRVQTYLDLVTKRTKRHTLSDLMRFADEAVHFSGEERLRRLYSIKVGLEDLGQIREASRVRSSLIAFATKEHSKRYIDLTAIDDIWNGSNGDINKTQKYLNGICNSSQDPIVKIHAKHVLSIAYFALENSPDAMKLAVEAQAIFPLHDPLRLQMLNENLYIIAESYLYYNDIDDALDYLVQMGQNNPVTPNNSIDDVLSRVSMLSVDPIARLSVVSVNLGDPWLAKTTARAYRQLFPLAQISGADTTSHVACAKVEDAIGNQSAVLRCFRG